MSRAGHLQYPYNLQTMPYCFKCRGELIYVAARYEGEKRHRLEWECTKCSKIYSDKSIRMPEQRQQDMELHERIKKLNENRSNSRRAPGYPS